MLLGVHAHEEGGDVADLLADAHVTLTDQHAGVMHGAGKDNSFVLDSMCFVVDLNDVDSYFVMTSLKTWSGSTQEFDSALKRDLALETHDSAQEDESSPPGDRRRLSDGEDEGPVSNWAAMTTKAPPFFCPLCCSPHINLPAN